MNHQLDVSRLIHDAPDVVFDAFIDPDAQAVLYGNDAVTDWTVTCTIDLRVGGTWVVEFGPSGHPNRETNTFLEVERPRRIVFDSNMYLADQDRSFDTTVTVTFEPENGSTLLTVYQTGFTHRADRDAIQAGWPGILEALVEVVATRKTG